MSSRERVVIVTGANRGIGNAISKLIAQDTSLHPLILYATSRAGKDLSIPASKDVTLHYPRLDIANPDSVASFAATVDRPVDVLINNAGVNLDADFSLPNARTTLETNYRGTFRMCQTFLPKMKKASRIVNLSSVGSNLKTWSPELAAQIRAITSLHSLDDFMMQDYLNHVAANTDVQRGFPSNRSYGVSKSAVNVLTAILARENPDVLINCCCPGWIDTEMGDLVSTRKVKPPKTVEEGARIPIRLGFGDIGGVSGQYWANDSVRSKEEGKVQEW